MVKPIVSFNPIIRESGATGGQHPNPNSSQPKCSPVLGYAVSTGEPFGDRRFGFDIARPWHHFLMRSRTRRTLIVTSALLILATAFASASATETEALGIRVLPAPGKVVCDGKIDDWDLSGGVFICSDVENLRGVLSTWVHLMYDQENLYILSRWIDDTPMNNPGRVAGDMGFQGDCLQVRTVLYNGEASFGQKPEAKTQRTTHITAWRDRDGKDVIDLAWGMGFDQGGEKDAKTQGASQAFLKNEDGKGYVQEMIIPWKLLAQPDWKPVAGNKILVTFEPNFGTTTKFRISMKDVFRVGATPDRVFTFMASPCWGTGMLCDKGHVEPQPLRLADNREFKTKMENGAPLIDWAGLYQQKQMEGFASLRLNMPEDGFVSLLIKNAQGQVVRQLLNAGFFTKGEQEVKWDGLTNLSYLKPGEIVPAGDYTWEAIWHKGLGLRLIGWACNGGKAPFDSPGGNWGGDMGNPCAVATDGNRMILGWSGSEAGQAAVCTDFDGKVQWRHKRGGFGGARHVAADGGVIYIDDRQSGSDIVYRLDANKGEYLSWKDSTEATLDVSALMKAYPAKGTDIPEGEVKAPALTGMDAAGGKVFLTYRRGDTVLILDGSTGAILKTATVVQPTDLEVGPNGKLYVVSQGTQVVCVDPASGTGTPVVTGLQNATAVALDPAGNIYVGLRDPDNQVRVFAPDGKPLRSIGKSGGRALLGLWNPDGLRFIAGLRVDPKGNLWVAEEDDTPRRFSLWNAQTGAFVKEFFGPTNYGAGGGAICPADPTIEVGHGCEWKIDAESGKAECLAVFHRGRMANARFGYGPEDRVYVAIGGGWAPNYQIFIYERLAPGKWKLRTRIMPLDKDGKPVAELENSGQRTGIAVWADANDDQQEQAEETKSFKVDLGGWIDGWYMPMTQSLTFYGGAYRLAPVSWTACGAPGYDPTQSKKLPGPPDAMQRGGMGAQHDCGTEDGKLVLYNGHYGEEHSNFECWDIESGQKRWSYPNNFVGVHGGHLAPPPQVGLIRGAYDIVGSVKMPEPIGDIFAIPTDKGEWHLLTRDGYYLSSLFQSDPLKIQWPDPAIPGAIMDNVPPGMGAEDFGGSISATRDGQLYIQAGKTAFIDMKVVGLDNVKKLGSGSIKVSDDDLKIAAKLREKLLQASVGTRKSVAKKKTVAFTGDLQKDFACKEPLTWSRNETQTHAVVAWDDANLYLGWSVSDTTPWVNGATEPAVLYACGDTVDFQFGTDAKADAKRAQAVLGDLRLSIGNFQGKATAVLYRPVAKDKAPRKFFSGTCKDGYEMQSVKVLGDAKIEVKVDAQGKRYVVEAAIPLATLDFKPAPEMTCSGDLGVTYGDPAGKDTVLRSYWNNQHTGLVADEVWELVPEPKHWGQITFE
jgi:hypothetical protein